MIRRGWIAILFSVFIIPLSGCGGGTSGSTPDPSNPSWLGKSLTIRAQILSTDSSPLVSEAVELEQSGQVKETNADGIANFSVVLGSKDEIVLNAVGQSLSVDPATIPAKTSLVGIVAKMGQSSAESINQREIRADPVGDCAGLMRRKDGIDFQVGARDSADGDASVPCGIIMRQTAKGEPDSLVLAWIISVNCQSDGIGEELSRAPVDADGIAQIDFDLDLSKRGCEYTIYPELDLFNPNVEAGGVGFNASITVR